MQIFNSKTVPRPMMCRPRRAPAESQASCRAGVGVGRRVYSSATCFSGPTVARSDEGCRDRGPALRLGTAVSIVGDGSLSKAQTWQDAEGYHVVLPNTIAVGLASLARGVRTRRLGTSLEILVQTKAGASVDAQIDGNRMQLNVAGKLQPRALEMDRAVAVSAEEQLLFENPRGSQRTLSDSQPLKLSSTAEDLSVSTQASAVQTVPAAPSGRPR